MAFLSSGVRLSLTCFGGAFKTSVLIPVSRSSISFDGDFFGLFVLNSENKGVSNVLREIG